MFFREFNIDEMNDKTINWLNKFKLYTQFDYLIYVRIRWVPISLKEHIFLNTIIIYDNK